MANSGYMKGNLIDPEAEANKPESLENAKNLLADFDFASLNLPISIKLANEELADIYSKVPSSILEVYRELFKCSMVTKEFLDVIETHHEKIQSKLVESRDQLFSYVALKLLQKLYLLRVLRDDSFIPMERPQHMFMRVALAIHFTTNSKYSSLEEQFEQEGFGSIERCLEDAFETYNLMSLHKATHASPSYFNSGRQKQQMASCFLLGVEDSLNNMYSTIASMQKIAAESGGIGLHISSIRAAGRPIRGGVSTTDGVIPYLRVLSEMCNHVSQGGKRGASIAIYLADWHRDIEDFCDIRSFRGQESKKARRLFNAIWVSDLFMKRVEENKMWTLMSEDACPGLSDVYGEEFEKLYLSYEEKYLNHEHASDYVIQKDARDLLKQIMSSALQFGGPYILFKDTANRKSNQNNIGVIKSSNLCAEIIQYSSSKEHAVCNLASLALPAYVYGKNNDKFDFVSLGDATRILVRNLNKMIDFTFYPTEEAKYSNLRHRPIGIGVQGLSDTYNKLKYPYSSKKAKELNRKIFETIYYNALFESCELAKKYGHYETFPGSQFSRGIFQFHMCRKQELFYNWNSLIEDVKKYGTRNSQLTAVMPTASTSYLFDNSECIEAPPNVFKRKTKVGEHTYFNKYLISELNKLGLLNGKTIIKMLLNSASIQQIEEIPKEVREVFKPMHEIPYEDQLRQAVDRSAFIDQSQSMNFFVKDKPNIEDLFRLVTCCHAQGLKTAVYYCRSVPAINPAELGIDIDSVKEIRGVENAFDTILKNYSINQDKNKVLKTKKQSVECIGCT